MKIEKLPSGNFRVRVVVGHTPNGKPIRKSFTHYDKIKLRRIASEYEDKARNGDLQTKTVTVREALDTLLEAKEPVLSPSTMMGYTSLHKMLLERFEPLCALPCDRLTKRDLQGIIDTLVREGNTPKTVRNYHAFLSAAFDLQDVPLPKVTLPRQKMSQIEIPDEDTIRRIADATRDTDLEIPVGLALYGLRRSEICGLDIDDLSDDDVIHVRQAVVLGADGKWHTKGTKTTSSDRYVQIDHALAEKIREQGQVTALTPEAFSRKWNRLLEQNNLPHYRLHDMRHFFVSYCHNVLKLSDAQIQAITGHSTPYVMRQRYTHAMHMNESASLVASNISSLKG